MRFISVQPHFRAGGSEMQTLLLSNELAMRGVDTHVILHHAEGELLAELDPAVKLHNLGVEAHALIPLIAVRLDRVLKTFDGGLVIVKLWSSLLAIQLAVARRKHFTYAICEDLDPLEHWHQIKLGSLKRKIIRPIFRHSPLILANTERVADGMIRAYSLNQRPEVLYGGIDATRIRRLADDTPPEFARRKKSQDGAIRIVTVASLRVRKGHLRILEALKRIKTPWEWHIVGGGPEEHNIRASIPDTIARQIYFHGAVPNPYPYIAESDILVHLPYSEAFGIVILEALTLGIPVISSPAIGPIEISHRVDPGQKYLTFTEPEDPEQVAAAILKAVLENNAIPSDITSQFTITSTANAWLSLANSRLKKNVPIP
jgi:glycosyltransferase involved in cell wall biosynthesis